jgi:hypothetical protein
MWDMTALISTPSRQVQEFLERRKAEQFRPRVIFALDATMSRQKTWDKAANLQAELFNAAGRGIDVQLVYFRGISECSASPWLNDPARLSSLMTKVDCRTGRTQIGRVFTHAQREADKAGIRALVYVGDAFEEKVDLVGEQAARLGAKGVPIFMFVEGNDEEAASAFREIARLSNGICARFDEGSAKQLAELLRTVGKFIADGNTRLALTHVRKALRETNIQLLG